MLLPVLDDVPDVAGADAQALRGHTGGVGGDDRVVGGQDQIAEPGGGHLFAAGLVELPHPAAVVGQEHQHQGGGGDEGLVVAGFSEFVLQGLVGDVQDGVEHGIPGGGGPHGGGQDGLLGLLGDLPVLVHPHGLPFHQHVDGLIHGGFLLVRSFPSIAQGRAGEKALANFFQTPFQTRGDGV